MLYRKMREREVCAMRGRRGFPPPTDPPVLARVGKHRERRRGVRYDGRDRGGKQRKRLCHGRRQSPHPGVYLTGSYVWAWGTNDAATGQFHAPVNVAIGKEDQVYGVDYLNHRVQEFTVHGDFVRSWGTQGSDSGQFNLPFGIAVGATGHVYIAEVANARIQEFTAIGAFVRTWGSFGAGNGQLNTPGDVAVARNGFVNVADGANDRVCESSRYEHESDRGMGQGPWPRRSLRRDAA